MVISLLKHTWFNSSVKGSGDMFKQNDHQTDVEHVGMNVQSRWQVEGVNFVYTIIEIYDLSARLP